MNNKVIEIKCKGFNIDMTFYTSLNKQFRTLRCIKRLAREIGWVDIEITCDAG